jgi:hypothetical protein
MSLKISNAEMAEAWNKAADLLRTAMGEYTANQVDAHINFVIIPMLANKAAIIKRNKRLGCRDRQEHVPFCECFTCYRATR